MRLRVSNERRVVRCMLNGVRLCCAAQSLRGGKAALAFTGADVRGDPGGAVAPSGSASCEPKQKPLPKSIVIGIPGGTRGPDHAHKTKVCGLAMRRRTLGKFFFAAALEVPTLAECGGVVPGVSARIRRTPKLPQ